MPKWPCAAALTSWLNCRLRRRCPLGGGLRQGCGADAARTRVRHGIVRRGDCGYGFAFTGGRTPEQPADEGRIRLSPHLSYAARRQEELAKVHKQAAALFRQPKQHACRGILPLPAPARDASACGAPAGAAHDACAPHSGFASASLLRTHLRDGDFRVLRTVPARLRLALYGRRPQIAVKRRSLCRRTHCSRCCGRHSIRGRLRTGSADGFDERLRRRSIRHIRSRML